MAEETKAKKEKAPPIEDKPFPEFIQQHFLPSLQEAMSEAGTKDLSLDFSQKTLPLPNSTDLIWQVAGTWDKGYRHFSIYFFDENIKGQKGFSCSTGEGSPSTIESFMIDERRVNLDLLVLYTLQRLNGEKWLGKN
ncbi:MAG: DUF2996 domain-containing protein [Spirulinaceae cyanobacterium SM2_1_0]|nr:DUF2996 domain-containing protein [Spirulinaceae cyanobacterium SM2_1_0]